jgi:hypothetical protein
MNGTNVGSIVAAWNLLIGNERENPPRPSREGEEI